MHKFLRAIGFSDIITREELQKLIETVREKADSRSIAMFEDEVALGDISLFVGENMGLKVCGEYNKEDYFCYDYYFPYFTGSSLSTNENSIIERHAANVSFAGVCEDNRIGISIIYYLQNRMDYIKYSYAEADRQTKDPLYLSGLSVSGMIMMPLKKDIKSLKKEVKISGKRDKLIEAARQGNEEAIESLSLDDIDIYSTISKKIKESDVYSIVDTSFMPYGVECDQYSILAEITEVKEVKNIFTQEIVYQLTLLCNGITLDVCINKKDLFGEPEVGRRFKGNIWLQGYIDFCSHS